jgi:hypothetical protein
MFEARTISVGIARDWRDVYEFASRPENFGRWASGLGRSLEQVHGRWFAEGPEGRAEVRFTGRNSFGILDHTVIPETGAEITIPMRVVANGAGAELIFTLFRLPGMTDETFASDRAWVERDLLALKALLEDGSG